MSAVLEEENTELLRLLNDERRRSKELEVQLKRERTLKEVCVHQRCC